MGRYVGKLEQMYNDHKILERTQAIGQELLHHIQSFPGEQVKLNTIFGKLDRLDKERVQYMISAENHAGRPPPNGIYAWSPTLEKSGRVVTYWKIRLSLLHATSVGNIRLKKLKDELKIVDSGSKDKRFVKGQLCSLGRIETGTKDGSNQ